MPVYLLIIAVAAVALVFLAIIAVVGIAHHQPWAPILLGLVAMLVVLLALGLAVSIFGLNLF